MEGEVSRWEVGTYCIPIKKPKTYFNDPDAPAENIHKHKNRREKRREEKRRNSCRKEGRRGEEKRRDKNRHCIYLFF